MNPEMHQAMNQLHHDTRSVLLALDDVFREWKGREHDEPAPSDIARVMDIVRPLAHDLHRVHELGAAQENRDVDVLALSMVLFAAKGIWQP